MSSLDDTPLRSEDDYGILLSVSANGEVAQLVEHHVRNVGVESSNLFFSTNSRETVNPLSTNEVKVARDFLCPEGMASSIGHVRGM